MRYYLAPMEGLTDSIYRRLHHKYFSGVDRYYMPFISPTIHRQLTHKEDRELPMADSVNFCAIPQVLTNNVEYFVWTAEQMQERGYDEINLNLGCPSGTVVSKNRGAGFLALPEELDAFLEEIFSKCPIDISIKSRIGKHDPEEWENLLAIYEKYPMEELIIHPRVQKDFYRNTVNMEAFWHATESSRHSLCYNGDICAVEDYKKITESFPDVEKVMIGRGLLKKPWLIQ